MKHVGNRGGPMGDDELEPLDPRLAGLKGIELMRASFEMTRPPKPSVSRRESRPARKSALAPFVAPSPPTGPARTTPADGWTPHDAVTPEFVEGHWADGIPFPDEEPPEEDR